DGGGGIAGHHAAENCRLGATCGCGGTQSGTTGVTMNQEMVEITALGQGGVWVEGTQRSACHSCSAPAGCGRHSLSQLGPPLRLWVPASGQWQVGQQVLLILPRGCITGSALLLYGLPLFTLLPAAAVGHPMDGAGLASLHRP